MIQPLVMLKRIEWHARRVQQAARRSAMRNLAYLAAYVRKVARRSIKPGKHSSQPGRPPRSHTGVLRGSILYARSPADLTVIVGPQALPGRSGEATEALEHGGRATITSFGRRKTAQISARPFMGPALEKSLPHLRRIWRDRIG